MSIVDADELFELAPEQRELLLRMGLVRRIRSVVIGNPEVVATAVARDLIVDLEAIGFRLIIAWSGDPDP